MIDPRTDIMTQIVANLTPLGLPIYNIVPSNENKPFIFIGQVQLEQLPNKSKFYNGGTVDVILYTGSSDWTGSLSQAYDWISGIKTNLQPSVSYRLNDNMTYWKLFNDTGLETIDPVKRNYICTLQYEFEVTLNLASYQVVHGGIAVDHNGDLVTFTH